MASTVAAHDFNGDGISDVIWGDPNTFVPGRGGWAHLSDLWYWDMNSAGVIGGIGHFSENPQLNNTVAGSTVYDGIRPPFPLTGNFDGDGSSDFLWYRNAVSVAGDTSFVYSLNAFDRNYEYGIEQLSKPFAVPPGAAFGESLAYGAADFNGDGRTDVLWDDVSLDSSFVHSTHRLSTIDVSHGVANLTVTPIGTETDWTPNFAGDFNGDGTDDVLLTTGQGDIALWLIHDGTLSSGGAISNVNTNGGWKPVGTGDFNHDGTFDLLVRNLSSEQLGIWTMQGGSIAYGTVLGAPPDQWQVWAVGDYNGDGTSDVLLRSANGVSTGIWDITNNAISDTHAWTTPGNWTILA